MRMLLVPYIIAWEIAQLVMEMERKISGGARVGNLSFCVFSVFVFIFGRIDKGMERKFHLELSLIIRCDDEVNTYEIHPILAH